MARSHTRRSGHGKSIETGITTITFSMGSLDCLCMGGMARMAWNGDAPTEAQKAQFEADKLALGGPRYFQWDLIPHTVNTKAPAI